MLGRFKIIAAVAAVSIAAAAGVASAQEDGDRVVKGTVHLPEDAGSVADVVVYVDGSPGKPTPKTATVSMKDLMFSPRVLAIPSGSSVEFRNADKVVHSIYSTSSPRIFDLGTIQPGESGRLTLEKPGVIEVRSKIEPSMRGYIIVVPNDHFTRPDEKGEFLLTGLPSGRFKIVAWHENLNPAETWVNLEEAKMRTVEMTLHR